MKSPRLILRSGEIGRILNKRNLLRAWKDNVRESMRRQALPDPLENLDLHTGIEAACHALERSIRNGTYAPSAPRRLLMEKSRGLCRQIVIPDAKDAIVLQCLSDALWAEIRKNLPSKRAHYAPQDHSFRPSHLNDQAYGGLKAWLRFQREIFKFVKEREIVAVTDIANYYDFIDHVQLRNVIAARSTKREAVLDFLIHILSSMSWTPDYMPSSRIGLPQIDLDAPRVLAHCYLLELDAFIEKQNVDYARFMDDIDLGVGTRADAHALLRDIDLVLQTRGVRLNSGKTRVMSREEAARYYRISENVLLNQAEVRLRDRLNRVKVRAARRYIRSAIEKGIARRSFAEGKGDKILKRLIGLAGKMKSSISDDVIKRILFDTPMLRESVFLYLMRDGYTPGRMKLITELLFSRMVVDDVTYLHLAKSLLGARMKSYKANTRRLSTIAGLLDRTDPHQLFARFLIAGKYAPLSSLERLVKDSYEVWRDDQVVGRLIGALVARFWSRLPLGEEKLRWFQETVAGSYNRAAIEAMNFHVKLQSDRGAYISLRHFFQNGNPSLPTNVTLQKYLMLLSMFHGDYLTAAERKRIQEVFKDFGGDEYYKLQVEYVMLSNPVRSAA